MKKDRREFLRLSALGLAGITLIPGTVVSKALSPQLQSRRGGTRSTDYEVIIVGAGLAGLTTAYRLQQSGVTDVLVLDANNYVGGRTLNIPVAGGYVAEGGGQWIGPSQSAILGLMSELGIGSFSTYNTGNVVGGSSMNANEQADYDNAVQQLNSMAQTIALGAPWNSANASSWDNMTFDDWLSSNMTTFGGYLNIYVESAGYMGAEPTDISLLYYLFYVASAGSVEALATDAQSMRIDGGAQSISTALAANLSATIELNAPVTSINDLVSEVEVTYNGSTATAEKVVVAMMPSDCANINFVSGLSTMRDNLQTAWVASAAAKVHLVYSTPFWRSAGFSGEASGTNFSFVMDNSPDDASSGILVAFPTDAFMAMPAAQREQAAKDEVETYFGSQAQSNIDYVEQDWSNAQYISGCVSPLPVGVLTSYGPALKAPQGNIHWAGTETSDIWTGYMDGAIRSGERAANEIVSAVSVGDYSQELAVSVYPNPVVDVLTIEHSSTEAGRGELLDQLGKRVHDFEFRGQKQTIDLSMCSAGVYSLVLVTNDGRKTVTKINKN